jgi:hypothetical protein
MDTEKHGWGGLGGPVNSEPPEADEKAIHTDGRQAP